MTETKTEVDRSPRVSARTNKGVSPERYQANLIIEPKTLTEALSNDKKSK